MKNTCAFTASASKRNVHVWPNRNQIPSTPNFCLQTNSACGCCYSLSLNSRFIALLEGALSFSFMILSFFSTSFKFLSRLSCHKTTLSAGLNSAIIRGPTTFSQCSHCSPPGNTFFPCWGSTAALYPTGRRFPIDTADFQSLDVARSVKNVG